MSETLGSIAGGVGDFVGGLSMSDWTTIAAVGIVVGGWAYSMSAGQKNNIFDPGAQEMPRINQSLRGSTVPVHFGTVRVSSNVVWQANFTVRRHENQGDGGGGKGGGSGGGKGGGSSQTTVTYDYDQDILFHLGLVPTTATLFGGWNGATRLSDNTIYKIQFGNSSGGAGFIDDLLHPRVGDLTFDEGFFGPGGATGDDETFEWLHFARQTGYRCRWPHTVYVGFKQLNLGGSPYVPQLSWEIGVGDLALNLDSGLLGIDDAATSLGDGPLNGFSLRGADGKLYTIGGSQNSTPTQFKVFRLNDGTVTDTITTTEAIALANSAGTNPSGWSTNFTQMRAIPIGTVLTRPGIDYADSSVFILILRHLETGTRSEYLLTTCRINASGLVESLGGWGLQTNSLNYGIDELLGCYYDDADHMVLIYKCDLGIVLRALTYSSAIPELVTIDFVDGSWEENALNLNTTMNGATFYTALGMVPGSLTIGSVTNLGQHNSYKRFRSNFFATNWFFINKNLFLVTLDPSDLLGGAKDQHFILWMYITKSDIEYHLDNPSAVGNCPFIEQLAPYYPDGVMIKMRFNIEEGVFTLMGFIEDGSKYFKSNQGIVAFPFTTSCLRLDGTADNENEFYPQPAMIPFILDSNSKMKDMFLTIFVQDLQASTDSINGVGARASIWIYNSWTQQFTRYLQGIGYSFDTVADLGVDADKRYTYDTNTHFVFWDELNAGTLIEYRDTTYIFNAPMDEKYIASNFGDLDLDGGEDVLVPYIIYEILTNPVFGIGVPPSFINETSYQEALDYCESEGFRVSTSYYREEGVLRVIELLLSIYGGYLTNTGSEIKFGLLQFDAGNPVRTIDNDHLVVEDKEPPVSVSVGALQDTKNRIRINYFDRSLEYRQNMIERDDPVDIDLNGVRLGEFPAQFVMSEATAVKMALRGLWSNLYARDRYAFKLGPKDSDLEPGDVVTLVDSFHPKLREGVYCRLVSMQNVRQGVYSCVGVTEFLEYNSASYDINSSWMPNSSGLFSAAQPPAFFTMYELPKEYQGATPRLYVGYGQQNFAMGARLYVSADNVSFARVLDVQPYVVSGIFAEALPNRDGFWLEEGVEIWLFPSSGFNAASPTFVTTLAIDDVSGPSRAYGAGLLWAGSEMLAYEGVNLVAQNRYKFDKLYRGWGGTAIHAHNSGAHFHKHGGGIFNYQYNEDKIGTTIYYKVTPYNFAGVEYDISSISAQSYQILGTYFAPQNPGAFHTFLNTPALGTSSDDLGGITYRQVTSGGCDIRLDWSDASRAEGFGQGGYGNSTYGHFATDTTSHQWRLQVYSANLSVVRSTVVSTAYFEYTREVNSTDFNGWKGDLMFRVTPFNHVGDSLRSSVKSLHLFG